jgi:hypothetical protein
MAGFPKRKRMGLVSHAAIISHYDFFVRMAGNRVPRSTSTASAWLCRRTWTAMIDRALKRGPLSLCVPKT